MATDDRLFAGSIPQIYDRLLVPLIFQPYADDLAARIAAAAPRDILEVAAGTGVLTRALALRLPDARISATDLNQPMLDQAASRQPAGATVTWRQADALHLPHDAQCFDAVACQFGVMFFPDRSAGYREARRVLRAHGPLFFNVWDRISQNQFAETVTEALAALFPGDPPRFMARTPHGYHVAETIRADLRAAGFTHTTIETVAHTSRAASARDAAIAYCQGTPLRGEIESRNASLLDAATDAVAEALARRFGGGAIEGRISALVVTASG